MKEHDPAVEVYWRLQQWLGFREGLSGQWLDSNANEWATQTDRTNTWRESLDAVDYRYPRDLLHVTFSILGDARGKGVKHEFRKVMRTERLLQRGACRADEVSDLDRWLVQLYDEVA